MVACLLVNCTCFARDWLNLKLCNAFKGCFFFNRADSGQISLMPMVFPTAWPQLSGIIFSVLELSRDFIWNKTLSFGFPMRLHPMLWTIFY